MPNINFERRLISNWLAKAINSRRELLKVKAYRAGPIDEDRENEDKDFISLRFLDTLRPELWCKEGLIRQFEPQPTRRYDLGLIDDLPRIPLSFLNLPREKTAWALFVEVDAHLEIFDDSYFLKKIRDTLGFGDRQNIDVNLYFEKEGTIAINDDDDILPPLTLTPGLNTVVITTRDQRVGAWLLFTFLCNYLDRGYKVTGFASSVNEQEVFTKWSPFTISDQEIIDTFGFMPDGEKFRTMLQGQHYQIHYDALERVWSISPPIFRFDIIHPVDILEDYFVATGYAFSELKPVGISSANSRGSQTKRSVLEERLVNYMQAYGARQTVGLLLDSYENVVERMDRGTPEKLIHLVNAVNKNREYAVDSSLPPLLRNAVHPSAPQPPLAFYLFTETLFLDEQDGAHSRWKMGILLVGTDHPFNNAHTLLDALCYHLRMKYTLKRSNSRMLIPGRQMNVFVANTPIGQFGEVHPEVLTNWELFYPTSFIELDLDAIIPLWTEKGA